MSLFYSLGKKLGPKVRKGKWVWQNIAGTQAEAIAAEYDVGKDLAAQALGSVKQVNDDKTTQKLEEIGEKLRKSLRNQERRFSFYLISDPKPNAFALPGGFIFVTDSLVKLCDSDESELAFVMGHEMGHVIKGHSMERLLSHSAIKTISRAAPGGIAAKGWIQQVGVKFLESAYSQDNEHEADQIGAKLILAGKFDRSAPEKLLGRLAKLGKEGNGLSVYFSTHPPARERIAVVKRVISQKK
ncbi:TPR repeat-containing protein YfgC precursor [Anaerohalosphaera lusitana]|uniref:TPR repeat-containing protein YfgC n=1 Tax=Anaerohalosphaera lusitana TaxID=1936003 RepID=A0A1U9NQA9_9BACT|nr:M48 family metallopeptidase [Anaerohalosphaera lusitana]AQT70123.1 TPR repeat-containing protein YfgC precursor [Anaerohalosphaera lusitana]